MATDKAGKSRKPARGVDFATVAGLALGVGGILTGLVLDGGRFADVIQFNAALIVLGGTIGAVMVTTPLPVFWRACRRLGSILFSARHSTSGTIEEIVSYAMQARQKGMLALEQQAEAIHDPFLRKALSLAVDGIEMNQIHDIMELEISLLEQDRDEEAKVFDAAGGYAPTIGIIGAVLGLMQVMKHLADIDGVGRGIAAAFVATVYGVGSANLLFLPAASKLRAQMRQAVRIRELMLHGVLCIVEGLNPKLIRTKLDAYGPPPASPARKAKKEAAPSATPVSAEG
jgi:chemotaxis protein MotA